MSSPEQLDMESKRDILAIRVMKMKKASMSQEEINEGLKQLIANDNTVQESSRMDLFNSVLREFEDLIGLMARPSSPMDTSAKNAALSSHPESGGMTPSSNQEPPLWLAPLLSAIGQNQIRVTKKKFLDPDTFDGDQKKYPVFKQQLKAKFDADPEDFPTAKKVYDYTLMRTTGSAARIMLSFIENANERVDHSMENFWSFLDSEFLDPHIVHKARDKLITISQGRRSVREYNADFREQLLLSGATLQY